MDFEPNWEIVLKGKYNSFNIEVEAYLDSLEIATSTDISASKIYEAIKDSNEVHPNLKMLYREAVYGTNKEVSLASKIESQISGEIISK